MPYRRKKPVKKVTEFDYLAYSVNHPLREAAKELSGLISQIYNIEFSLITDRHGVPVRATFKDEVV
jgi:hypothetical protein